MNNARLFQVFPVFSEIFFQIQYDTFDLIVHTTRISIDHVIDTLTQRTRSYRRINTIKVLER